MVAITSRQSILENWLHYSRLWLLEGVFFQCFNLLKIQYLTLNFQLFFLLLALTVIASLGHIRIHRRQPVHLSDCIRILSFSLRYTRCEQFLIQDPQSIHWSQSMQTLNSEDRIPTVRRLPPCS
jgi:hypothetical protein